jgi:leucyl-tRNA synthetase
MYLLLDFMRVFLILMNPIVPHFCEHAWVPLRECLIKANYPTKLEAKLVDAGWPKIKEVSVETTGIFTYLQDLKRTIRQNQGKSAGKKKKNSKPKSSESENKAD